MDASQLSRVTESEALLKSARNRIVVVHYACSDFYKVPIEISCIVAKEFVTGKTMSFSRTDGISEKELSSKFYAYVQRNSEKIYVGWNLKDTTYGFPVLERRYRELFGKEPPKIRQIIDLDGAIKEKHGRFYVNHGAHGKLHSLMVLNGLSTPGFRSGKEEIELHERKNFREIEISTNCKVSGIANILGLFIDSKLKTQIGVPMTIWGKFKAGAKKIVESTTVKIILLISAILAIMSFVMYLWS